MSALPKAVQKQVSAAEDAHKKAYTKPEAKKDEVDPNAPKPEETGQEVQPEKDETPPELRVEPSQEEAKLEVVDKKPETTTKSGAPVTEETWEERYTILQGKFDAEVPRQAAHISELRGEIKSLRDLLAKQQTPPPAPEVKPEAPPRDSAGRLLKPEEVEDYGEELIDVMKRAGQEVFNPEVAALKEELNQLKQQLGGVSQTLTVNKRDSTLNALSKEVPNWEALNTDERFLSWLDQTDPYSGEVRQDMLSRAFQENHAARVIAFFKGYLNENEQLQPPPQTGASQERNTQRSLDDMVAPGKPQGASGVAQKGEKRMWTQKQISQFYQKVNTGMFVNRPKDKEAIERDIVAAAKEGRITA